ncbi:hypothetical protein D3C75_1182100 [compost metagenome]
MPISRGGRLTSSAAWGITAKPTNMNGTIISTVSTPALPPTSSGSMLPVSPSNSAPVMNITPTARISTVTTFWISEAVCTPK